MSNPRPCVCGHLPGDHDDPLWPILGRCRRCIREGHWATGCLAFRPAPRKEPLRVGASDQLSREDEEWLELIYAMWDADDEPEPGRPRRLP